MRQLGTFRSLAEAKIAEGKSKCTNKFGISLALH